MVDRNVSVKIRADISDIKAKLAQVEKSFEASANSAEKGSKRAGTALQGLGRYVERNSEHIDKLGSASTKLGLGLAAIVVGTTKAAIDWESAWAGVTKTVDGTTAELSGLHDELRTMARTMPAAHSEIAAVAEAAGQLGVKTRDVAGFTKVMIQLAETTNLTADEAATTIAQFMNIMGSTGDAVDNLGAALVALGNNGASTERDIIQLGQRFAAAGRQVGMAESDVLAYANALASVGVEAEAGGTAMTMAVKKIAASVREGGDSLNLLARTAGMSASEFRRAFNEDAGMAVATLVEGLGELQASGGDVNAVLSDLGIKGIRESDALLRLAGATKAAGAEQDLLRESLKLGRQAWTDNTALIEEYAKRAQTTEAQAKVAWNRIKDSAITAGEVMLPLVASLAQAVGGAADAFGRLSPEAQSFAMTTVAVVAGAALVAGGVAKMATTAQAASVAFKALGVNAKVATASAGAIGLILTAASLALGSYLKSQAAAKESVDSFTTALQESNGAINENVRLTMAKALQDNGAFDAAQKLGISLSLVTDAAMGNAEAMEKVRAAQLEAMRADGNMVSTSRKLGGILEAQNGHLGEAQRRHKQLAEASGQAEAAQGSARKQVQATTEEYAKQRQELTDLVEMTQAYGNELLALSGSQIAVEASIAGVKDAYRETREELAKKRLGVNDLSEANGKARTEALKWADAQIKAGRGLDLTTEAGRRNQTALDTLARSSMAYIKTLVEQGASTEDVAAATARARTQWVNGAVQMGMTKQAAQQLADAYFAIPKDVGTKVSANTQSATAGVQAFKREVDGIKPSKNVTITTSYVSAGVDAARRALESLTSKTVTVTTRHSNVSVPQADGSVLRFYENGGMEHHVAQIAPAGAWRVWAEPETGGEAYIPLAKSKRPRSLEILRQTAAHMGHEVVPLAGGALMPSRSVRSGPLMASVDTASISQAMYAALSQVTFQLDGQPIDVRISRRLAASDLSSRQLLPGGA